MANLSVRGTGCANARTSGSVGALAGNRQGHPALLHKPPGKNHVFVIRLMARDVVFFRHASGTLSAHRS